MKRLLCFSVILIVFVSCASAETPDFVFEIYNGLAEEFTEFEADTLPDEYSLTVDDDGSETRIFSISDKLKVLFCSDQGNVYEIAVWYISASVDENFLSACKIATITMMLEYKSDVMDIVEQKYRFALEGKESGISIIDDYYIHLAKQTGYFFTVISADGFREHNK